MKTGSREEWLAAHARLGGAIGIAIALLALPAIFALVRQRELSEAVTKTTIIEPALTSVN